MYCVDPGDVYGKYVVIGASQTDQYEPLYARLDGDQTITKWMFNNEERQAIAEGAPLYLFISRPGGTPLQPIAFAIEGVENEKA
jgi:hypothetical protein